MIKRILLALADTQYATASIRRAIELALLHEAEITAVTAINTRQLASVGPVPVGAGAAAKDLVDYRFAKASECLQATIREFKEACRCAGIDYFIEHERGNPFQLAIDRSRYHDLMICGLRHVFDDNITEESPHAIVHLIADGVRPILAEVTDFRIVHRVLIAYSGSMESAKTMKRFVQLRLWPKASIRIVTYEKTAYQARELLRDAVALCKAH